MLKHSLYLVIAFHFFLLNKPLAQGISTDTTFYTSAADNVIKLYTDSVRENLRLYNGNEFTGNYPGVPGHPFFEFPEPRKGEVFYDGTRYPNVLLSYDIINDDIIFNNPVSNRVIKLVARRVEWFTIQNHLFVHIRADTNTTNFPGAGFYEVLYEGAGVVLTRRKKQFEPSIRTEEASRFIEWTWYYVKKDAVYYAVKNRRSLLAICRDQKKAVAEFMGKEKLNFKNDPANTIVKVIDYYTQIKKN